jgi:pantothenate synthetase
MQLIIEMLAKAEANRKTDKEERKKADIMLAKLDAYQEKAAADRKADKEEMKADITAWREEIAAETEVIKARTRAIRENMGTSHKEMVAVIEPGRNMETIACQEMEAHPEEE